MCACSVKERRKITVIFLSLALLLLSMLPLSAAAVAAAVIDGQARAAGGLRAALSLSCALRYARYAACLALSLLY